MMLPQCLQLPRDLISSLPTPAIGGRQLVGLPPLELHYRRISYRSDGSRLHVVAAATTNGRSKQATEFDGRIRMKRFYEVELQVRDYELDQFGVVNHVVYGSYCQHGRQEFIKSIGLNPEDIVRSGGSLVTTELSMKFVAPLRASDKFVVKVRVSGSSAARFNFEHFIFKLPNEELILEANAVGVWLGRNNRPLRIPSALISNLLQFEAYSDNGFVLVMGKTDN